MDPIRLETRGSVLLITLNRPDVANAVDQFMAEQLYIAMRAFENSDNYKAAVLCSSSNNFCSGYDVKDLTDPDYATLQKQLVDFEPDHSPMAK